MDVTSGAGCSRHGIRQGGRVASACHDERAAAGHVCQHVERWYVCSLISVELATGTSGYGALACTTHGFAVLKVEFET